MYTDSNFVSFHQQLNWTSRPFAGDVQVNWRYTFPAGDPPEGLLSTMLVVCKRAAKCNYHYHWRHGILIKTGEVNTQWIDSMNTRKSSQLGKHGFGSLHNLT